MKTSLKKSVIVSIGPLLAAAPASAGGLVVNANAPLETVITGALRFTLALVALFMLVSIGHAWLLVDSHGGNEEKKAAAHIAFRDAVLGFVLIVGAGYAAPQAVDFAFGIINNGISI